MGGPQKRSKIVWIKQHVLLFTCQRHADAKTKPKQGASRVSALERHRSLASAAQEPIPVTQQRRSCQLQLFPFAQDSQVKPAHAGPYRQRQTHIKVLEGQDFKSGSLLVHKPFLLNFLTFTSYKILGTSFQFFHLSSSSKT